MDDKATRTEGIATSGTSAAFVGRERETRFLEALINEVASATASRGVVLSGAPGQGKSTLLRFVNERCVKAGLRTVMLRAAGPGISSPQFPAADLLSQLGLPSERVDAPRSAIELARSLDTHRPASLAVLLDDAQWIPQEGLEMLVTAMRLQQTPSLLVLALRRNVEGAITTALHPTGDLWFQFLELEGLERENTGLLAECLLDGELLPSLVKNLHDWTRGNPLFIKEVVREWQAQQALHRLGSFWTSDSPFGQGSQSSLNEALAFRLSRLDVDSLRLVQVLSLLGRPAQPSELLAIGLAQDDLLTRLEVLIREQFVEETSTPDLAYGLAHPLYGTAALSSASAARRAVLHETILQGLLRHVASGGTVPASELASHAVHAAHKDQDVESLVTTAAEEALASGVYSQAARWFGALSGILQKRRADASDALEKEAGATAQFDPSKAAALYTALLENSQTPLLLLGRARSRRRIGDFDGAMRDLQRALPLSDDRDSFSIRHEVAALHGILGQLDIAEALLNELAAEGNGPAQTSRALGHLAQVRYCTGDVQGAYSQAAVALKLAVDPEYRLFLKDNLAWYALILGRWREAAVRLAEALDEATRTGNLWSLVNLLGNQARLTAWTGKIADAFDYASRAQRVANQLANGAEQWSAAEALAIAHYESGNPRGALASLAEVMDRPAPFDFPERSRAYALMAEMLLSLGSLSDARDFLEEAQQHLPAAPSCQISIDRVQAGIQLAEGNVAGAIDSVQHWIQQPSPLKFDQALLLQTAASTFLLGGQGDLAMSVASQARGMFDELGATKHSAEIARWIADTHRPRRGRPPSQMPWGLTARELDVLRLLIAGKTDPEIAKTLFVSVGTVKKHVENIKAKVGLRRRVELVGLAPALKLESYIANPQNPR